MTGQVRHSRRRERPLSLRVVGLVFAFTVGAVFFAALIVGIATIAHAATAAVTAGAEIDRAVGILALVFLILIALIAWGINRKERHS